MPVDKTAAQLMFEPIIEKRAGLSPEETEEYLSKYYRPLKDEAHGVSHIEAVRARIRELAEQHGYKDKDLADMAALLHDIGNIQDRETHERIGAEMVSRDPLLKKRLNSRRMRLLVNAIRQHRASTGKPRSTLGKLLSDADRLSASSAEDKLTRAFKYHMAHYTGATEEEALRAAAQHIANKYGPEGYGTAATHYPETKQELAEQVSPIIEAQEAGDVEALRVLAGLNKAAAGRLFARVAETNPELRKLIEAEVALRKEASEFIHYVPEERLDQIMREGLRGLGAQDLSDPEAQEKLLRYARFLEEGEEPTPENILKAIRRFREHEQGDKAIFGFPHEVDVARSPRLEKWLRNKKAIRVKVDQLRKDKKLLRERQMDAPPLDYSKVRDRGPALADIPHPSIITEDGTVPPEYLEVISKTATAAQDFAPGLPRKDRLGDLAKLPRDKALTYVLQRHLAHRA